MFECRGRGRINREEPRSTCGKMLTGGQTRKQVPALSRGVLAFLLQTAAQKMPEVYPAVLLLARTGMRIGEALALQTDDLDFDRREIHVRRTWGSRTRAFGDVRINVPKGGKERSVDMSEQLCQVL
jgi:integrase